MYKLTVPPAAADRAGIETLAAIANATFAGAERLAALNLNAVRSFLEDSAARTRALVAVGDPQGLMSLQGALAAPGLQKAGAYSRRVLRIAAETREALSAVLEDRISELARNADRSLEAAARSAPAGTAIVVDAMRSTLAAANSVYDSLGRGVRQVGGLADASLVAVAPVKAARKTS